MNRIMTLTALVLVIAVFLGMPIAAHGPGGGGGRGGGYGHTWFDSNAVVTLSGTVTRLYAEEWETWGHGNHTGGGMAVEFRSNGGEVYDLMLAPVWYLAEAGIELSVGDAITVRGSVVDNYYGGHQGGMMGHYPGRGDNDYLISVSLTSGSVTIELRDTNGYPLWSMHGSGGMPWFDPDTVKTLSGTLSQSLGLWSCWGYGNYTGNGMHYRFTADGVTYYAMLAPLWFLQEQGITLADGTAAKIRGSVVDPYWSGYDDASYLIAQEMTIGGKTVTLRDENGYPLWYGGGWYYVAPTFQSATVADIAATVVRTRMRSRDQESDRGLELIVRAGSNKYTVFVSPEWYAKQLGFVTAKGAAITIRGSVLDGDHGKKQIVAVHVQAGGVKYRFRSPEGTPRWIAGAK